MNARKICPYPCCPHNALFQDFDVPQEPIITDWIRENGACMLAISPEEEQDGVAGMRRGASQEEIAEHYQVRLHTIQYHEERAFRKIKRHLGLR